MKRAGHVLGVLAVWVGYLSALGLIAALTAAMISGTPPTGWALAAIGGLFLALELFGIGMLCDDTAGRRQRGAERRCG